LIIDAVLKNGYDSHISGVVRVIVTGACYVGRSLTRMSRKRKVMIPEIKYGITVILQGV